LSFDDWFRRRRFRFPFFDIEFPFYSDIEEMMREFERRMDEAFRELAEQSPKSLRREVKTPDGRTIRELGPFVYGYSVTIGPDGKPVIREFGNVKPSKTRPGIDIKEVREPLVDTISTNGELKVIAEIPGVEKQDIKLSATERSLEISVDTPDRKYHKEVDLPVEVEVESAQSIYKNGVLEVTFKKKEKKPKGISLKVE